MAVLEEVRLAFGQSSFYILIYAQLSCEFYHLRIGHLLSSDFVTGEGQRQQIVEETQIESWTYIYVMAVSEKDILKDMRNALSESSS